MLLGISLLLYKKIINYLELIMVLLLSAGYLVGVLSLKPVLESIELSDYFYIGCLFAEF